VAHSTPAGRHRASARYNPVSELSTIASRAGVSGAKASAVLAASGGLVAAFALPASASQESATAKSRTVSAPAAPAAVSAAPAIVAPATATPVKVESVGVFGVTAVAKPKPKPKPKPKAKARPVAVPEQASTRAVERVAERTTERSSTRSTTRTTQRSSATTSARTAPRTAPKAASRTTERKPVAAAPKQSSSQIVNIARGLLGVYYVYGGTTPAGFGCSGFTQYVYRKAGISIPRTASAQQAAATRVSNPQPGDLVFYGSPAYHVGIFTGGDMMIDSPRTGKATSERNMWGTPTGFGRF